MPNRSWSRGTALPVGQGNQGRPRMLAHRPRAVLPAGAQAPLFTVRGGPIRVHALYGKVTTPTDATATNLSVLGNPANGLTDVTIGGALAVASKAVGTLVGLAGTTLGAALTTGGALAGVQAPPIVDAGTLDILTSATNAGALEWFLLWEPLHPQAEVTPVLPAGLQGLKSLALGAPRVLRRRSTVIPASGQAPLFRVKGGPIRLLALLGDTQVAFSATATNLSLLANPDSGLTDVLLATAVAVANLVAGTLLSPTGAIPAGTVTTGGAGGGFTTPPLIDVGTVDVLTDATNTGEVEWLALWEPAHQAGKLAVA